MQAAVRLLVHPASLRFGLVAGALSWSSRGLTRTIRAYVAKLETLATTGVPSLCSDVRVWAASGFHTLPGSTVAFDARFMPNWVSVGELPAALARYETPSERPLIRRTEHLEAEVAELEAREVETYGQIMNALGCRPDRPPGGRLSAEPACAAQSKRWPRRLPRPGDSPKPMRSAVPTYFLCLPLVVFFLCFMVFLGCCLWGSR